MRTLDDSGALWFVQEDQRISVHGERRRRKRGREGGTGFAF